MHIIYIYQQYKYTFKYSDFTSFFGFLCHFIDISPYKIGVRPIVYVVVGIASLERGPTNDENVVGDTYLHI